MFAPGSSHSENKENPNPPNVTFRMVHGRPVPIINGQVPRGATNLLHKEIKERTQEVKNAARGERGVGKDSFGNVVRNFGTKSTYPNFYSQLGFRSKAHYMQVLQSGKGQKHTDLINDSIQSLLHGRDSSHGRLPPNDKFRLATKQEFDNRGVSFKMKDGKVTPMRFSSTEKYR